MRTRYKDWLYDIPTEMPENNNNDERAENNSSDSEE